jgi:hypothetical protein
MKTRVRQVLERRFGQWATGQALSAFSAAAFLGLTLASEPASAQESLCEAGYGGPSVAFLINGEEVERRDFSDLDPMFSFRDAQGRLSVDLRGTYTSGSTTFMIVATPNSTAIPRVFVAQGIGGVDLLVATDILVGANFPVGTPAQMLTLVLDSERSLGSCPGGLHTFGATMDGSIRARNPTSRVEVTAEAILPSEENTFVINRIAGGDGQPPSTVAPPFVPIGGFSDEVTEDLQCGRADEEFSTPCTFQLRNTITFTVVNPTEQIKSAGSFAAAVVERAGGGLGSALLAVTGVGFDRFNAKVTSHPRRDTFKLGAIFELGHLSGGINPPNESFTLSVGEFATTLPQGAFVERERGRHASYTFKGLINGEPFKARITRLAGKRFSLVTAGHGANLMEETAFLDVAIGDDKGSTAARVFPKGRIGGDDDDGDDEEDDDEEDDEDD